MSYLKQLHITKGKLWQKYVYRCNYCGNEETTPLWWIKLKYIFKDKTYHTCKHCHKTSCYRNFIHIVHDSEDKKEKQQNRNKLWDNRIK